MFLVVVVRVVTLLSELRFFACKRRAPASRDVGGGGLQQRLPENEGKSNPRGGPQEEASWGSDMRLHHRWVVVTPVNLDVKIP